MVDVKPRKGWVPSRNSSNYPSKAFKRNNVLNDAPAQFSLVWYGALANDTLITDVFPPANVLLPGWSTVSSRKVT